MAIFGYILAVLIGLALGIMGGGGSILAVPVLHYVVGYSAKASIAMSLAVVGGASLFGAINHWRVGNMNLRIALIFGSVAMVGTYLGAVMAGYLSGALQLVMFAVVMLAAAYFMFEDGGTINDTKADKLQKTPWLRWSLIGSEGLAVGILTGIVGVGGGFLIVPALVLLADVEMKRAVGISLLVISMKSASGFVGYLPQVDVDWFFLAGFTGLSIIGIVVGSYLVKFITPRRLKRSFAIFLVVMGIFIFTQNIQHIL